MSTNGELIAISLRDLNVIGETATASTEQGAYCLGKLNAMLESWAQIGIDLGFYKQTSTTDTCPIPDWAELAVTGKLAQLVAPHYGANIAPELAENIRDAFQLLQRKCMVEGMQPARMDHLPMGSGRRGNSILTDN